MAKRAVKRGQSVLDPMFNIPEGTDEFIYSDSDTMAEDALLELEGVGGEFGDYTDTPGVPYILGVVSQVMRTTASGSQVVDVTIEVEEIGSLSKYELRVTKV